MVVFNTHTQKGPMFDREKKNIVMAIEAYSIYIG